MNQDEGTLAFIEGDTPLKSELTLTAMNLPGDIQAQGGRSSSYRKKSALQGNLVPAQIQSTSVKKAASLA